MIVALVLILTVSPSRGLKPKNDDEPDEDIKRIIANYVNTIPDLPPKYIMNEGLTKMISKYYGGKINTFPLYKISFKVDRNPVKIPWTLGAPSDIDETKSGKKYTLVKVDASKSEVQV